MLPSGGKLSKELVKPPDGEEDLPISDNDEHQSVNDAEGKTATQGTKFEICVARG